MPRSLKKGPFIAYHLLKKIDKMNAEGKKDTITTWSRSSQLPFTMVDSMFQFLFLINLLVIN